MSHQITKQNKLIYLDHAASTPLDPEVFTAMLPHLSENYGNPSSLHQAGRTAYDALKKARESVATTLAVSSSEIIFTGSGTESDNLALLGLARANQKHGKHVIVSAIEHKAVLAAAQELEREGFNVTYLPVDTYGTVDVKTLKQALTDETILVSIMYANNEIGTIEPIGDIVDLIYKHYGDTHRPLIHTDACQAVGMLSVLPRKLNVDAITINSSKIYGPKGIGLLYLKSGTPISPLIVGGDQEHKLRAGTESVALIVGFAAALQKAVVHTSANQLLLSDLQKHFMKELQSQVPDLILNGHPTDRLPNNIHLCITDIEGESIVLMLDEQGVCAATGSACSSLDLEPSHVLRAIGREDDIIHGSVRFTFGLHTTKKELTYAAQTLGKVVCTLRKMTASSINITSNSYAKNT